MLSESENKPQRQGVRRLIAILFLAAIVSLVAWSYFGGGFAATLLDSDISSETKMEMIREFFDGWGIFSPLVYLAIVTVEVVVAPIPGTLIYLPGGYVFGGLLGGTLALAGNVLGAGIACQLMRSLVGTSLMQSLARNEKLIRYQRTIDRHGFLIVMLLRLNPLTSSDLVSYAAGLTAIPTRTVMLATLVGMAPLCYAQAYMAMTLFQQFPWLVWPLIAVCLLYFCVVFWMLWSVRKERV